MDSEENKLKEETLKPSELSNNVGNKLDETLTETKIVSSVIQLNEHTTNSEMNNTEIISENIDSKIYENDLEDGEIETDDDDDEPIITMIKMPSKSDSLQTDISPKSIVGSSKSSKIDLTVQKFRSESPDLVITGVYTQSPILGINHKKPNKYKRNEIVDDDWAGNIENAIAAALKRDGIEPPLPKIEKRDEPRINLIDDEPHTRSRKRKKRESEKSKNKKKTKHIEEASLLELNEEDDFEMLCIRGASPPPSVMLTPDLKTAQQKFYESDESYTSYSSSESCEERRQNRKLRDKRSRNRKRNSNGREKRRKDDEKESLCALHSKGNCTNEECLKSSESRGQRKMELCKFYLMECCAKKEKCLYMHSDFPCKYYYLGMDCVFKAPCKFSHGRPLNDQLRNILLKHIETAPKEILGNFRRLTREIAIQMLNTKHKILCEEYGVENTIPSSIQTIATNITNNAPEICTTNIPSLLDIVIKPPNVSPIQDDKTKNDKRKTRWCDTTNNNNGTTNLPNFTTNTKQSSGKNCSNMANNILSLQNLSGVITHEQIEKFLSLGIENLEQINQMTVAQLNSLGLTINQINEIQLNALNIQKLGLISSDKIISIPNPDIRINDESTLCTANSQDVDMRFLPSITPTTSQNTDNLPQFKSSSANPFGLPLKTNPTHIDVGILSPDSVSDSGKINICGLKYENLPTGIVDYSQYLKDSNLEGEKTDNILDDKDEPELLIDESWCSEDEAIKVDNKTKSSYDSSTFYNEESNSQNKASLIEKLDNNELATSSQNSDNGKKGENDFNNTDSNEIIQLKQNVSIPEDKDDDDDDEDEDDWGPIEPNKNHWPTVTGDKIINKSNEESWEDIEENNVKRAIIKGGNVYDTDWKETNVQEFDDNYTTKINSQKNLEQQSTLYSNQKSNDILQNKTKTNNFEEDWQESTSIQNNFNEFTYFLKSKENNINEDNFDEKNNLKINTKSNDMNKSKANIYKNDWTESHTNYKKPGNFYIDNNIGNNSNENNWDNLDNTSKNNTSNFYDKNTIDNIEESGCSQSINRFNNPFKSNNKNQNNDDNWDDEPIYVAKNKNCIESNNIVSKKISTDCTEDWDDDTFQQSEKTIKENNISTEDDWDDLSKNNIKNDNISLEISKNTKEINSDDNEEDWCLPPKTSNAKWPTVIGGQMSNEQDDWMNSSKQLNTKWPNTLNQANSENDWDQPLSYNTTQRNPNSKNSSDDQEWCQSDKVNHNKWQDNQRNNDNWDNQIKQNIPKWVSGQKKRNYNSEQDWDNSQRSNKRQWSVTRRNFDNDESWSFKKQRNPRWGKEMVQNNDTHNEWNIINQKSAQWQNDVKDDWNTMPSNQNLWLSKTTIDPVITIDEEDWDKVEDINSSISISSITSISSRKDFRDPRLGHLHKQNTFDHMIINNAKKPAQPLITSYPDFAPAIAKHTSTEQLEPRKHVRISIYDSIPSNDDEDDIMDVENSDQENEQYPSNDPNEMDLKLPFKTAMTNYTPATEIDGSIASHAPLIYKVCEIDIAKPDYTEVRKSIPVPEKTLDPRLRRIFCLKESSHSQSDVCDNSDLPFAISLQKPNDTLVEKIFTCNNNNGSNSNTNISRGDPRCRKDYTDTLGKAIGGGNRSQNLDIRVLLQKSIWYKNLNSKFKIMVNQQLALVSTELKKFHQDASPNKIFDMKFIASNQYLQQILTNLGIYIDGNGQILQLETENDDNPSGMGTNMIGMIGGVIDSAMPAINNTNTIGITGMTQLEFIRGQNPLTIGPRFMQFDPRFTDIRPGLMGIAPGIPYNPYDNTISTDNISNYNEDKNYIDERDIINFFGRNKDNCSDIRGNTHGGRNFRQNCNNRSNPNDRWSDTIDNNCSSNFRGRSGPNNRRNIHSKGLRREKSSKL